MENQENILKTLYFDPSGFQSQQKIYSEAKKQDKTISLKDVKEWYLKNVEKNKILWLKKFFCCTPCEL